MSEAARHAEGFIVSRDDIREIGRHNAIVGWYLSALDCNDGAFPEGWEQMLRALVAKLVASNRELCGELTRLIMQSPTPIILNDGKTYLPRT